MHPAAPKPIDIFTDGACSGNPGPGGYGVILVYQVHRKEISGGFRWTTNNRMELTALKVALQAIKVPCRLTIHTDSKYLMDGFEKNWIEKWKKNGWMTQVKEPVQNRDLWQQLDSLLSSHAYQFHWIKGHGDHQENNRCDELAVMAAKSKPLEIDHGYESANPFLETYKK